MKFYAVYTANAPLLAAAAVYEILMTIVLYPGLKEGAEYGADLTPFIGLFGLESIALAVTVLV